MRGTLAFLLAFIFSAEAAPLLAQPSGTATGPRQVASTGPSAPSLETMGFSFQRIKRELRERSPSTKLTPLKLTYYVEVTGLAPRIPLFSPQDLAPGPVPGGPPTHWEMVAQVTRPEFRAGSVPISSLAIKAVSKQLQWDAERQKRWAAEEDLRKRKEELSMAFSELVVLEKK